MTSQAEIGTLDHHEGKNTAKRDHILGFSWYAVGGLWSTGPILAHSKTGTRMGKHSSRLVLTTCILLLLKELNQLSMDYTLN